MSHASSLPTRRTPPGRPSAALRLIPARWERVVLVEGWLISRIILLTAALSVAHSQQVPLADVFARWDAGHFLGIAAQGYFEKTETAFFPGLPLVIAAFGGLGVAPVAAGAITSTIASGFAAWALYRLAGRGSAGVVAALLWCFAPMAVFTVVPYSESLFCAFAFWAFVSMREGRWRRAGGLAAAACLMRVSGLFLLGALALAALLGEGSDDAAPAEASRFPSKEEWLARLRRLAWIIPGVAVLTVYAAYLKAVYGSWTTWFQAQSEGWFRGFHWPWEALTQTLSAAGISGPSTQGDNAIIFALELVAILIGLIVTVVCLVRRRWVDGAWVGVQVIAFSFQVWFISVARAVLLWFPVWTLIGLATTRRPRALAAGAVGPAHGALNRSDLWIRRACLALILIAETIFMVWWARRFFSGAWAS
ncbi:MAG: hypothetical protein LBM23_01445 [Propionibacteriaceae bacterium]|jgi:hypothetical protein|nr:hypothetical protein [Propionibacteriaceae bacterium]